MAADYSGSDPDPGYAFDGDGNLVKESENGSVKSYFVRSTLLNATIAELTSTGALEEGAVLSNVGSRIAVLKDSEFHFFHVDPSGSYEKHIKVDKSTASKTQYDPTGRKNNYPGPTGAGPCGSFCPPPYNPPGGFDGLAILQARIRQQRWQDTYLSLLPRYAYHGIVIGMDPPLDWDPSDSQEDLVNWNLLDSHHERYGMLPRPDGYATVSFFQGVRTQNDPPLNAYGFSENKKNQLESSWKALFSKECKKAFRENNLLHPGQSGLRFVFVHVDFLLPGNNDKWEGNERLRLAAKEANKSASQGFGVRRGNKYFIFFNRDTWGKGIVFNRKFGTFEQVFVHEVLHGSGAPAKVDENGRPLPFVKRWYLPLIGYEWTTNYQPEHDLEWLDYDAEGRLTNALQNITKVCSPK